MAYARRGLRAPKAAEREQAATMALLLLGLALAGCWGNPSDEPPVHLQQNMDFQERGEAQERNDFFADHRVMRPPVPETVAVGHLKEDDHMWRGRLPNGALADALPAGLELGPALLDRGQKRYDIYCQPCHGEMGYGDGPATRRGGGFAVKPANFHQDKFRPVPLGYFYDVATNGKGSMKGYKSQIPVEDRWAIAAWVRTLQVASNAEPSDVPEQAAAAMADQRPRRIQ
ncbi:c-type cytochrome [Paraliomyxa miuraensis]|uniref:c-type cytochrome n=1 Tax=Paraliomyxa miuraensis TaxID=376150 RepID=UPI0022523DF4|nr:cytochrome c [Paraliomyxa miuraensis]MCX4239859.1 cytochrome c [Paraliomyxa miuraensis]